MPPNKRSSLEGSETFDTPIADMGKEIFARMQNEEGDNLNSSFEIRDDSESHMAEFTRVNNNPIEDGDNKTRNQVNVEKPRPKRKRADGSPQETLTPIISSKSYEKINKDTSKLNREVKRLTELIEANVNTKVEIKKCSRTLEYVMNNLLHTLKICEKDDTTIEEERKSREEKGTQANYIEEKEDKKTTLARMIRQCNTYDDMKDIIEKEWPEDVYETTKEETAYPVKSDEGWDLAGTSQHRRKLGKGAE